MVQVGAELGTKFPEADLLLTVHDELVLEAPADQAQEVGAWAADTMSRAAELKVPLVVEVGVGKTGATPTKRPGRRPPEIWEIWQ